jgi:nicotinamidase-related amidase
VPRTSLREGDAVIPVLNDGIAAAEAAGVPAFATRDWHPPDHVSFEAHPVAGGHRGIAPATSETALDALAGAGAVIEEG